MFWVIREPQPPELRITLDFEPEPHQLMSTQNRIKHAPDTLLPGVLSNSSSILRNG